MLAVIDDIRKSVKLRYATNKDFLEISTFVKKSLDEFNLVLELDSTDKDLVDIEATYFNSGGMFKVLESSEGKIIATYGFYAKNSDTCELRKVYLDKDYRGRGLGKVMLNDAIETARQMNFRQIVLETANVLKNAIHLYKKHGFEVFEPETLSSRCDFAMKLEL